MARSISPSLRPKFCSKSEQKLPECAAQQNRRKSSKLLNMQQFQAGTATSRFLLIESKKKEKAQHCEVTPVAQAFPAFRGEFCQSLKGAFLLLIQRGNSGIA